VLYRAPEDAAAPDPILAARRGLLALAERKRASAAALVSAGQPGEALTLFRDAMTFACRALDPRGDPGAEPAALLAALHGHLIQGGLVTEAEAAAMARAGEAARAFGGSTVTPPEPLMRAVSADAAAVLARATVEIS
jgi:hypothetical protein